MGILTGISKGFGASFSGALTRHTSLVHQLHAITNNDTKKRFIHDCKRLSRDIIRMFHRRAVPDKDQAAALGKKLAEIWEMENSAKKIKFKKERKPAAQPKVIDNITPRQKTRQGKAA